MPKILLDVDTLARLKTLKPDLDYKQAEFAFEFKRETSAYVQLLLDSIGIKPGENLTVPLPVPLRELDAVKLNDALTQQFDTIVA